MYHSHGLKFNRSLYWSLPQIAEIRLEVLFIIVRLGTYAGTFWAYYTGASSQLPVHATLDLPVGLEY
jgi:hypothetical protein